NRWWIGSFGMIGAAWATLVSYLLALAICIALGRKLIPIWIDWNQACRVALASLAMVLVVTAMPDLSGLAQLALRIAIGMATYGLIIVLLDVLGARSFMANWLGLKSGSE